MKIKDNIVNEFDEFSKNYTSDMINCVPYYNELISSFITHLPPEFNPITILDLGCGNGNVTHQILKKFPNAKYTLLDASQEMLNLCQQRFNNYTIKFVTSYFHDFEFKDNTYDYIVGGFSLHHCKGKEKKILFNKIYSSLKSNGIFSCSDLMINKNSTNHPKLIEKWKAFVLNNYKAHEKWKWLMEHYNEFDNPDSLEDHLSWLRASGFTRFKNIVHEKYWIHLQAFKE